MSTDTLAFATIAELAPLLAKKKISPVELAELHLARIAQLQPKLNAFITLTAELALAQARAAERELLRGRCRGPLHGIPLAIKDNIWIRGVRTTAGSAILSNFVPAEDATVIRRLRRAGAVLLGKTNLNEFAYGITGENAHYGPARNPWALDRIPGGSSAGSATAIAAGLCVASIGTDTGGSLRVPAAMCGIVGFKPTFGRVSVHGTMPLAPSFDHVGPLARSVGDAALLLSELAGRDPRDPSSAGPRENFAKGVLRSPRKPRLGLPQEYFWEQLDPQVRALTEAAVRSLVQEGALAEPVSLPGASATVQPSNEIALAEARQVHESAGYFPARAADYTADVRQRLVLGREVRAVDYLRARETMQRARAEWEAALAGVDAIVFPTVPVAAPPIGTERVLVDGQELPLRATLLRLTRPSNFTGLPAISIPCGFTPDGLPVGLQLVGRAFGEAALLKIARLYEQAHEWAAAHPPLLRP